MTRDISGGSSLRDERPDFHFFNLRSGFGGVKYGRMRAKSNVFGFARPLQANSRYPELT
jgi:hypothetical protein